MHLSRARQYWNNLEQPLENREVTVLPSHHIGKGTTGAKTQIVTGFSLTGWGVSVSGFVSYL